MFTGFNTILVVAGYFSNSATGLTGLCTNPPPQLGHTFCKISVTQVMQKVHSKLQIMASVLLGGRGLPQFSQTGLNSSIKTCFGNINSAMLKSQPAVQAANRRGVYTRQ